MSFEMALPDAELTEGGRRALTLAGWPVLVCRSEGELRAVINRCTHAASTLEGGRVRRGTISCPLHGARFDLKTGACLGGTGYRDLMTFPTRLSAGMVEVDVPDYAPDYEHYIVAPAT